MQRALMHWFSALLATACAAVALLGLLGRGAAREDAVAAAAEGLTVVVDAGHGGFDGGAVGPSGVPEAGLNLAVAQALEEELAARGISVLMTRTDGEALGQTKQEDMASRKALLADARADAVVSVHMNKFGDASVHGAMAYYMQGSAEGEALAQCVINAVTAAAGQAQRLANPGDYFVVRECSAPAVLVECGFLSNPEEEQRLLDPDYHALLARAIADGVRDYFAARAGQ